MRMRVTFPFELSIRRGLHTESIMQRPGGGVAAPGTARAHPPRGCHSARTSEGPVSPADVSPMGIGPAFHPPWPAPNTQELRPALGTQLHVRCSGPSALPLQRPLKPSAFGPWPPPRQHLCTPRPLPLPCALVLRGASSSPKLGQRRGPVHHAGTSRLIPHLRHQNRSL